jgi:hypothetical protein
VTRDRDPEAPLKVRDGENVFLSRGQAAQHAAGDHFIAYADLILADPQA